MDTDSGDMIWSVVDVMPLSNKPIIAPDDKYIYTIRENGVVAAYDLKTSEEIWSITCADLTQQETNTTSESVARVAASCVDLVESESSVSPNGLVLFYGDKFGNVKALQLAQSIEDTAAPTEFPTFAITQSPSAFPSFSPSAVPSDLPSHAPSTTFQPTNNPTVTQMPTLRPVVVDIERVSSASTWKITSSIGACLLGLWFGIA
jgi:hypothetical protein